MAFQVKELMVSLNPYGQTQTTTKPPCSCVYPSSPMVACGKTEGQCPAASALLFCGNTEAQCPTASALDFAPPGSRQNLELLRRNLAARNEN